MSPDVQRNDAALSQELRVDRSGAFSLPLAVYAHIEDLVPRSLVRDGRWGRTPWRALVRRFENSVELRLRNYAEVVARLVERGYSTRFTLPSAPRPSPVALQSLHFPLVSQLISQGTLTHVPFSQVEVDNERDAIGLISDLCQAFLDHPISIVLASSDRAAALARRLKPLVTEAIGCPRRISAKEVPSFTPGNTPADATTVPTPPDPMLIVRQPVGCRINVVIPQAAQFTDSALAPVVLMPLFGDSVPAWMKRIAFSSGAPRIHLIRIRHEVPAAVEAELCLRFGPMLARFGRLVIVAPEVAWIPFGGSVKGVRPSRDATLHKRPRYWTHTARNKAIAKYAKRLHHTPTPDRLERGPTGVIVVENREHGQEVQRHLAGWGLASRHDPWPQAAAPIIATISRIHSLERPPATLRWLINAMGGGPSPTLERVIRELSDNTYSIRLVDVTDRFRPDAAWYADLRRQSYAAERYRMVRSPTRGLGGASPSVNRST